MIPKHSRKLISYGAAIVAGVSYGLNPLFAKPLLEGGVAVESMLFFRYLIAMLCMALLMVVKRESFHITRSQMPVTAILGLLFSMSSLTLFIAYKFIPSGLATTVIYLYPVFTALIMMTMGVHQTWKTWLSIAATFGGVVLLCLPSGKITLNLAGIGLAILSALCYALYLVIVNRSQRIKTLSSHALTFYALGIGAMIFYVLALTKGVNLTHGLNSAAMWLNVIGLGVFPTMVSLLALAISTRSIGPTKTSVLGVFEPLTAIFIGTVLFAEPLTVNIIAGATICIAAVTLLILQK